MDILNRYHNAIPESFAILPRNYAAIPKNTVINGAEITGYGCKFNVTKIDESDSGIRHLTIDEYDILPTSPDGGNKINIQTNKDVEADVFYDHIPRGTIEALNEKSLQDLASEHPQGEETTKSFNPFLLIGGVLVLGLVYITVKYFKEIKKYIAK